MQDRRSAQGSFIELGLAQDRERCDVVRRICVAFQWRSGDVGRRGQAALPTVTINEETLLDLVQDFVLEILRGLALQEFEAERVDCPDEHLREAGDVSQLLAASRDNPLLQFGSCLLRKRERHDVPRYETGTLGCWPEEVHDAARNDLGLPGPGTSDQLEIPNGMPDGSLLVGCKLHSLRGGELPKPWSAQPLRTLVPGAAVNHTCPWATDTRGNAKGGHSAGDPGRLRA